MYIKIYICDSMWCFWVEVNCTFVIICLYLYCHWRSSYQEEEGWEPINQFNPATFACLSLVRTWISNIIHVCLGLFYLQCVEIRDDCSFCWCWWNCWPSLFKLSFHKVLLWRQNKLLLQIWSVQFGDPPEKMDLG